MLILILVFGALTLTTSQADAAGLSVIHAVALPGKNSTEAWDALQVVQADRNGKAFLLRVGTLQVYPVSRRDGLGSPSDLAPAPSVETPRRIRDAAMGSSSGDWAMFSGINEVREFRGGEERKVPPPGWQVAAVAWPTRGVLVSVLPVEVTDTEINVQARDAAPVLLREGDAAWDTVASEASTVEGKGKAALENLRWRTESRLAPGAKGSVWLALQAAYRVRRYGFDGKLIDDLVVGDGKPRFVDRPAKEMEEIEAAVKAHGGTFDASMVSAQRAERVIAGMTGAPDGRLYLIVQSKDSAGSGLVLDRFDPDRDVLERVGLADIEGGRFFLAPAKDALFVVAANGAGGRWYLEWDELENAKWTVVPKATHNGEAIPRSPEKKGN